jgi:hypothetical protein
MFWLRPTMTQLEDAGQYDMVNGPTSLMVALICSFASQAAQVAGWSAATAADHPFLGAAGPAPHFLGVPLPAMYLTCRMPLDVCRAMVELHRALEENNICRSPLLDGHQTKEEVRAAGCARHRTICKTVRGNTFYCTATLSDWSVGCQLTFSCNQPLLHKSTGIIHNCKASHKLQQQQVQFALCPA